MVRDVIQRNMTDTIGGKSRERPVEGGWKVGKGGKRFLGLGGRLSKKRGRAMAVIVTYRDGISRETPSIN